MLNYVEVYSIILLAPSVHRGVNDGATGRRGRCEQWLFKGNAIGSRTYLPGAT